jgi:hypothetical protein
VESGESPSTCLNLDARPLLNEVLRRQARSWCRAAEAGEGPPLEQLLALVPPGAGLQLEPYSDGYGATWQLVRPERDAAGSGDSYADAIRAATCELLGLDAPTGDSQQAARERVLRAAEVVVDDWYIERCEPSHEQDLIDAVAELRAGNTLEPRRRCCGTCKHWVREGEPVTGEARLCDRDRTEPPRTAESSCPDGYEPLNGADTDPAPDEQLPGVSVAGNLIRSEGGDDGSCNAD